MKGVSLFCLNPKHSKFVSLCLFLEKLIAIAAVSMFLLFS